MYISQERANNQLEWEEQFSSSCVYVYWLMAERVSKDKYMLLFMYNTGECYNDKHESYIIIIN